MPPGFGYRNRARHNRRVQRLDFDGALRARLVGPHRGGRVTAVAGHPTDSQVFYFGHCAGGVWRTSDGGRFWENISDGYIATGAVGALAVSESDPTVLLAGMGETNIRGNVSHGDGVYRSTDGGRTWRNVGLRQTRHIARIRIHPRDPRSSTSPRSATSMARTPSGGCTAPLMDI
jgi:hypothetical protein